MRDEKLKIIQKVQCKQDNIHRNPECIYYFDILGTSASAVAKSTDGKRRRADNPQKRRSDMTMFDRIRNQ